jgi:peroxiredoxin
MALTPSNMLPLGTKAPDFRLADTATERMIGLSDFRFNKALVVMFICNHCPFVKHMKKQLADFGRHMSELGVGVVAISSNDVITHPGDHPTLMKKDAEDFGYTFPYLFDETQEVAKSFQAACTPDFYLFDGQQKLVYRGQFDSSRPSNSVPVTGEDLRAAVLAVLAGKPVSQSQQPSIGCNIKWRQ